MLAVTIIAIAVAFLASAAGWFATYILTIRAQDRLLSCQLLSQARLSISSSMVAYENWLKDVQVWLRYCSPGVTSIKPEFAHSIGSAIGQYMREGQPSLEWESALLTWEDMLPELSSFRNNLVEERDTMFTLFVADARFLRDYAMKLDQTKLLDTIKRMSQANAPLEEHISAVAKSRRIIDEACLAPVARTLKSIRR